MTSKEALEQLRKYNGIGLCGDETLFEPIEKDLDELEELKNLMGTPIQDIVKCLKILEILKKGLVSAGYIKIYDFKIENLELGELIMIQRYLEKEEKK